MAGEDERTVGDDVPARARSGGELGVAGSKDDVVVSGSSGGVVGVVAGGVTAEVGVGVFGSSGGVVGVVAGGVITGPLAGGAAGRGRPAGGADGWWLVGLVRRCSRMENPGAVAGYVAVGNEPFLQSYNGFFLNTTFPALQNIQNALNAAGPGSIVKATIPLDADVFESPTYAPYPSEGRFRPDINELMTQIAAFFNQTKSPFTVKISPFLSLYRYPNFPHDFAFFDGIGQPVIDNDNGIQYTNKFDAIFDTLVWALKRAGFPDMPIIIGEVGWPTDGDINANTLLAQRFYNGLMERLAVNQGTPLRPNTFIEVYLFGLMDEDAKSIARGDFEQHWGIFTYDGQPKFQIDLGQNSSLVGAKNFKYLKQSWISKVANLLWAIWMEKNNVRFNISQFAAFCADTWHKGM